MPWFDKALKSVQNTAGKAGFEADKLMRVKREEGALATLQNSMQTKLADLGRAALALHRSGGLSDPSLLALAEEVEGLEVQIAQQEEKIAAARSEQHQAAAEPEAAPAVPEPPAAPAAAATVECPNCHTQVGAGVTFCPECGTRLK
jgi:hypothetical protein